MSDDNDDDRFHVLDDNDDAEPITAQKVSHWKWNRMCRFVNCIFDLHIVRIPLLGVGEFAQYMVK